MSHLHWFDFMNNKSIKVYFNYKKKKCMTKREEESECTNLMDI